MNRIEGPKGRIYPDHSPKTVALIGMGPSFHDFLNETLTQELTPEHHDEVWGINMIGNSMRCDLIFWMDDLRLQAAFKPGLIKTLADHGQPVMTAKRHWDLVPNSYDFPIDEIGEIAVKTFGKPYLNNGVAMAIAYAIWKKVKCIKIYGCDFTYPNREFAESGRACVEAWITLAIARGIAIGLPPHTSIMDVVSEQGVYGYAEQPEIVVDGISYKYQRDGATAFGKYNAEQPGFVAPDSSKDPAYERIKNDVLSAKAQADSATGPRRDAGDGMGNPPELAGPVQAEIQAAPNTPVTPA